MKILDERGRIFGKINLFDLIALVILVLGIFLLVVLRPWSKDEAEGSNEYRYAEIMLESTGMRDYMVESLKEGDILYEGTIKLGEIKEIEVEKQKVDTLLPDGSYQAVERELFYDVMLTIETDRYYENDGRYINGNLMLNGTSHTVSTGLVQFDVIVWDTAPGDIVEE